MVENINILIRIHIWKVENIKIRWENKKKIMKKQSQSKSLN